MPFVFHQFYEGIRVLVVIAIAIGEPVVSPYFAIVEMLLVIVVIRRSIEKRFWVEVVVWLVIAKSEAVSRIALVAVDITEVAGTTVIDKILETVGISVVVCTIGVCSVVLLPEANKKNITSDSINWI